jgi:hypothetical protein
MVSGVGEGSKQRRRDEPGGGSVAGVNDPGMDAQPGLDEAGDRGGGIGGIVAGGIDPGMDAQPGLSEAGDRGWRAGKF